MATPQEIVQKFCDLMVRRDAAAVRPYIADDAVYQNVGMPATVGVDDIVANLIGQFEMFADTYEYVMKSISSNGDTVLTERIDQMTTPTGKQGLPVMGAFVVRDGKITRWHDYWDMGLVMKMMTGEDVSGLIPKNY